MKTIIGATLVLLSLNSCTNAQNQNIMEQEKGMTMENDQSKIEVFKSQKEMVINISAEKLWAIIGPGFADYGTWATIVDHAEGIGEATIDGAPFEERVCEVNGQGQGKVTEKLLKYSDSNMNLAYEAVQGMPEMMHYATNDMTVLKVSNNTSKIAIDMAWGVHGPLDEKMSGMMEGSLNTIVDVFLNDIKVFAETGKVSDAKQKRIAELANKM